jgi:hypothetical protein
MATTYTINKTLGYGENGRRKTVIATIAYSAVTYGTSPPGLPVTGASLGLPNTVESVLFVDDSDADTNLYKYDYSQGTIRVYVQNVSTQAYAEQSGSTTVTVTVQAIGW